jgi:hypothetical protein
MALTAEPAATLVKGCVGAIEQASCETIRSPEQIPDCASLFGLEAADASSPASPSGGDAEASD